MPIQDLYERKLVLAAEVVRQVRNDDFVIVPTGVGDQTGQVLAALTLPAPVPCCTQRLR